MWTMRGEHVFITLAVIILLAPASLGEDKPTETELVSLSRE